jgi:hypothetical protein
MRTYLETVYTKGKDPMSNADNPAAGARFEKVVQRVLAACGMALERGYAVPVGAGRDRQPHRFDLGGGAPR